MLCFYKSAEIDEPSEYMLQQSNQSSLVGPLHIRQISVNCCNDIPFQINHNLKLKKVVVPIGREVLSSNNPGGVS